MIRLAVLGAGNHSSEVHGRALEIVRRRRPGTFAIAAVCDLDESRARQYAERFGAGAVYTDYARMLDVERPDALLAITPIEHTERIVADLLPRGLPLLIEKPPGADADAAERLAALAAEHAAPHMVSFNRRFTPALARVRQWIAADPEARRPRLILARMLRRRRLDGDFIRGTAIHQIDAIVSFLGPATAVTAERRRTGDAGLGIATWQADFAEGARAAAVVAPDVGTLEETYEFYGPDFTLTADALGGAVTIRQGGTLVERIDGDADAPAVLANGTVAETEAFLDAVAGAGPYWPTLADTIPSMRLGETIARQCGL
ncbi:MAG: Gfo/Idh/MocA family oxidoreductase [Planctomycetes bacterium]|nr:Gfo/Idh/MocA family oxidoreductase [Planctomycetota bacterium]